ALLFAVARVGGARSQARLAAAVAEPIETAGRRDTAALEAMGMLCARLHPATAEGLEAVAGRLLVGDATARAAAYVVDRCAGPSAELLAGAVRGTLVERLTPMLDSPDEALARRAWKAIAGLGEVPTTTPPSLLSASPPGWRVEVEAVRALAGHADGRAVLVDRLAARSPADFEGPRVHVLLESLRGLRDAVVGSPELRAKLSPLLQAAHAERGSATARRLKALALIDCEAELLSAIGTGTLERLLACADGAPTLPDGYADVLAVEAILRMGAAIPREDKAKMLLERAADPRPRVASAALAALVDVDDARIPGVLALALARADVGVQAAAATAIATRSSDRARRDESVVAALEHAVKTWPNATAIEGRIAAVMALGNLARSRGRDKDGVQSAPWLESTLLPLASDPAVSIRRAAADALAHVPTLRARFEQAAAIQQAAPFDATLTDQLASLEGVTGLRMTTSAGVMTMRFEGAAPYNQATVTTLADKGFYDGLTMHRVVPGFVIQGGDPRGDGYGGPGFLVPCERSNQKYERGVVGMALAGKDTGGSQFFVAQDREPRLDGRYTILGRVTEGLDVLDRVLPHDEILRVEVVRGG
ncbi:MAG: peptidylprolyl isomerase, partial [Myxococcota bacterium]